MSIIDRLDETIGLTDSEQVITLCSDAKVELSAAQQRVRELEAESAMRMQTIEKYALKWGREKTRGALLSAELDALREIVERLPGMLRHKHSCRLMQSQAYNEDCDCGFDEVFEAVEAAEKARQG